MRAFAVLAAIAALLVAGCAAPDGDDEDDPLFGLCPQWVQGTGTQEGTLRLDASGDARQELGPANGTYLDRPLDLYRVQVKRIDVTGDLELRAESADGVRLSLRDYRLEDAQVVPVVRLGSDAAGDEVDVLLSSVLQDGPREQAPATLLWTLAGERADVEYTVTFHYKVCGL